MFISFDENKFRQAIKEKDFIRLKSNTVSTMLNDPAFAKGETMQVIEILRKEVPEIFEEEIDLGYEERLEPSQWDKRYFTKLTYWFEENFALSRIAYIEEVGKAITGSTVTSKPEVKKPVAEEKVIEEKPAEIPVIKSPAPSPVQKESAPVKPTVNPTPAPKKKSKLPIIVAAVAAAAVVAVILIIGFFR